MTFDAFERKYQKLKSNNPGLIERYENVTNDNIDDNLSILLMQFDKLSKLQTGADPISFMQDVINHALKNEISLYDAGDAIVNIAMIPGKEKTILQQYFNEISRVYDKNDNNYNIVYCPENLDKLIEMNLKTVISIAKGYQGLGLTLEELISAGNLGLVICAKGDEKTHIPKYDPNRAKLKDDMIAALDDLNDDASEQDILSHIHQYMTYGDIKKKFVKNFGTGKDNCWNTFTKTDVIKWIKRNVHNATFNSVAFMWIRAYILIEIDNSSRLVKKPKSEIYNDKLKYGAYQKEITLDIDAPIGDDNDTCFGDILNIDDDKPNDLDVSEAYDTFKDGLNKLLEGVKSRDRAVFLKKFGIGLPRPMLPKEIAEQENLSIARISQIFQSIIEQMQINQIKYNINPDILFDAARKLN